MGRFCACHKTRPSHETGTNSHLKWTRLGVGIDSLLCNLWARSVALLISSKALEHNLLAPCEHHAGLCTKIHVRWTRQSYLH
jgi:hypothetical protein